MDVNVVDGEKRFGVFQFGQRITQGREICLWQIDRPAVSRPTGEVRLLVGEIALEARDGLIDLLVGKKFFGANANRSNQGYKIIVRWTERVLLLISLAMHYECSIVKGYIKKGTSEEIPLVFNRIL